MWRDSKIIYLLLWPLGSAEFLHLCCRVSKSAILNYWLNCHVLSERLFPMSKSVIPDVLLASISHGIVTAHFVYWCVLYVIIHFPLYTSGPSSRTVIISALVCANACVRARLPLFQPDPWSYDHQKRSSHASSCGYQVSRDRGGRMLAPGISAGFLSPINISRLILQLAATGRIWQEELCLRLRCLKTALCWRWGWNSSPRLFNLRGPVREAV